jgi:MoaA/NifB/PqqE/SkfB family radical SAM enzyme
MKIPHTGFCVLPWISLETSPIGTVRPCCLAEEEIPDSNSVKFNLASADLDTVQNSEHMRQLRQSFLAGERPVTCRKCWTEEDAGRTSKRMHTLERLKHMIPDQEWTHHPRPLMFLDLKLGNICNLKCRICGSWSSSAFATEEVINIADPAFRKSSMHYQMLRQGAWPRENPTFWRQINDRLDQIRYIEFTGGEPFMIQEHFDLLQGLIDRGVSDQVEIHYNTNGSIWPDQGPEIWKHFRQVEVAFSIDDQGERFNYQRSGADWTQVLTNIDRFRKLRTEFSNVRLQICCTISVFNVLYIGHLWDLIRNMDMDFIYWNMLHGPPHLSIAHAPESVKAAARYELSQWFDHPIGQEFRRVQTFMDQGKSWDGRQLLKEIKKIDHRREEQLIKALPELYNALGILTSMDTAAE